MPAPDIIKQLVERFEQQQDTYLSKNYTETPVRRDFIDPFFAALGWDIDNKEGYAETYRDVIHEDRVSVQGKSKSPDYSFRIGGVRKFFVEAKQPSISLKKDPKPAFQLRRYGWSGKLPVSILTDFEEFAVYDCTIKPSQTDAASKGRLMFYTYKDYIEKWDEIYALFSKEAILKGSFDRFASKKKRGTTQVDDEFLAEIENWRQSLASNILQQNEISQRDLNYAVQITIDRIIFLRICEDRGIEQYGRLEKLISAKGGIYKKLVNQFKDADDKYNSGLFHFNQKEKNQATPCDTLTPKLKIDDIPLQAILQSLYFPNPYEFSVLPADILGQIYERFLGKVIEVDGKTATITEKPEVKKAGGVFYTPSYIVEYIVQHTVGKLLEGKTPNKVAKLSILDPACGSGSFLIVAYQHLLDWHMNYYLENGGIKKYKKELHQTQSGGLRLTTQERKRILLNNIYGVDIDNQAVEVTKLSLLLKVLEGESNESINSQFKLFHERALPDLASNIKCGNSLIGSDFYAQMDLPDLTDDDHWRINVFDWKEAFADVFSNGGFDAVIGNPPYGGLLSKIELGYLGNIYPLASKSTDSYCYFMVKSNTLLKKSGWHSFIVPNTFCDLEGLEEFRRSFLSDISIAKIWETGWAFEDAVVDTLVYFIKNKRTNAGKIHIKRNSKEYHREVKDFKKNALCKIDYRNTTDDVNLLNKITKSTVPLSDILYVKAGVKLYEKGKGSPAQTADTLKTKPYSSRIKKDSNWRPLIRGAHIKKYIASTDQEFVSYGQWLAAPRNEGLFNSPKIVMRRTDDKLFSALDQTNAICVNSCHVMKTISEKATVHDYMYYLGVINSRLMQKVFEIQNPQMVGKVFAEIKVIYVERLPIKIDKAYYQEITTLVERLLALESLDSPQAKGAMQGIDSAVYQLYGLTDEEIGIIESSN